MQKALHSMRVHTISDCSSNITQLCVFCLDQALPLSTHNGILDP